MESGEKQRDIRDTSASEGVGAVVGNETERDIGC